STSAAATTKAVAVTARSSPATRTSRSSPSGWTRRRRGSPRSCLPSSITSECRVPGESRERMVEHQLRGRGIADEAVLAAMERVPRELFVPVELRDEAYADAALPIGGGQTISQPY